MRLQHLVPIPAALSLVAATDALRARVDVQTAELPRDGSPSLMQRFETADLPMMLPLLRGTFDARGLATPTPM